MATRHLSRWASRVLAVAVLSVCLAGVASAAPIEIEFWHMETPPNRVAAFQAVIDEFNASQTGIKVSQQTVSWGDVNQKLMSALASGSEPDFTFVSDTLGAVVWETGRLQPVDDLVKEIDKRWGMIPANVAPFTHHGHTWAVPIFTLSHLLYYRTDLAAQAGLAGGIKTWGDLTKLVSAMHQVKPDLYGIALPASKHKYTQQCFYDFMITNGATIFDATGRVAFDNPKTVQALTTYKDLLRYSIPDKASLEWSGAELVFATGRASAMFFFGSLFRQVDLNGVVHDKFAATLPPLPDGGTGRVGSVNSHNAIVMFAKDKAKQQAIRDFVLFWLEPERYGKFLAEAETGLYIPVTRAGMDSKSFWNHPLVAKYRPMILKGLEASNTAYSYNIGFAPDRPFNARAGAIEGSLLVADVVQKIAFGEMTPAQAAKWGQEQLRWLVEQ